MKSWLATSLVVFCIFTSGCGGGASQPPAKSTEDQLKEKTSASTADLKKRLEDVAASGSGGSGLLGIKESIEQTVRPTNAALATELLTDYGLLSQTSDPATIKTIATQMAGKIK